MEDKNYKLEEDPKPKPISDDPPHTGGGAGK